MNPPIDAGSVPPQFGTEKEEPELAQEDDIPSDDRGVSRESGTRPARDTGQE